MTEVERLAEFAVRASYDALSERARDELKIRVLDTTGCAIGAIGSTPAGLIRRYIAEFDPEGPCTLIGGGSAPPDRATFYNGALARYLDFNDSYLAKGETCHPSDNLAAVLAAVEYAHGSGRDLLAALAIAYQVQCRMSDEAPVRARGFDHTTQGTYAVAAAVSKALGSTAASAANAIGICGTAFNALRVTRTGRLSQWKGLAYPNMAANCMTAALLARAGLTGPIEVIEGNKGFIDAIAGPFSIDWPHENLERVTGTILKRHNAEIHSQTTLDAALALRREARFDPSDVQMVEVETFDVAFTIIGGGEEGDKRSVETKEQADHSLPYLVAAALLDGRVSPAQFTEERIRRADVQRLLQRVIVRPNDAYSRLFPAVMPSRVTITLSDGTRYSKEQVEYPGLGGPPFSWSQAREKFEMLAEARTTVSLRNAIADTIEHLESVNVSILTELLAQVR